MKRKIANQSLVILFLIVVFGLFQAWKESRNPFAFISNKNSIIVKSNNKSTKSVSFYTNKIRNYSYKN
jgi:hypothetical protein